MSPFRLSPARLLRLRALRPFARHLLDRHLWHITPHSVGAGLACGLFFGFLIPLGQIFCAVFGAVLVRGNLAVAASATFISNPFTFPPIYYAAWKLGGFLAGLWPRAVSDVAAELAVDVQHSAVQHNDLLARISEAGGELLLGLVVLAILASALGYGAGWAGVSLTQRLRGLSTR